MHCSDEQLLAHLDGELAVFTSLRVQRHLKACWRCRTRLAKCESEVQKVTVSLDEWQFPAREWSGETKQRLNRRIQAYEQSYAEPRFRRVRGFAVAVLATAAAVLIGIAGWLRWTGKPPQPPRPAEVIARISRADLHAPRPAPPRSQAPALPVPGGATAIDPRAVEAQFVLHLAGACLGETVRISEESGWTRVERLRGDPNSYRRQLDVSFVLNSLAELRRDQPAASDRGARAVALRNAWAMRRLGDDFPVLPGGSLSPSTRKMLGKMLDDHAEGVRRELAALGQPVPASAKLTPGKLDWRQSAELLFDALANVNASPDPQSPAGRAGLTAIGARLDEILTGFSVESSGRSGPARIP